MYKHNYIIIVTDYLDDAYSIGNNHYKIINCNHLDKYKGLCIKGKRPNTVIFDSNIKVEFGTYITDCCINMVHPFTGKIYKLRTKYDKYRELNVDLIDNRNHIPESNLIKKGIV